MTEEIKEIYIRMLSHTMHYDCCYDADADNDFEKISDYMINLQKENEKLQEELQKADSITQSCIFEGSRSAGKSYRQCLNWLEDYKSRNEKAVEYIKQHCEIIRYQNENIDKIGKVEGIPLLNILEGGDE